MKNLLFIALLGILIVNCNSNNKNEKETRNLQQFDKVTVVGNIALNLEKTGDHAIEIMSENEADITDLITEVRNGELFIEHKCDHCVSPKYIINLSYTSISDLSLNGVVKLNSYDVISQESLAINGNGIFYGNIETAVSNLNVDLKGISTIKISGNSDVSDLNLKGIGMINASSLKTKNDYSDSKGLSIIYN